MSWISTRFFVTVKDVAEVSVESENARSQEQTLEGIDIVGRAKNLKSADS